MRKLILILLIAILLISLAGARYDKSVNKFCGMGGKYSTNPECECPKGLEKQEIYLSTEDIINIHPVYICGK